MIEFIFGFVIGMTVSAYVVFIVITILLDEK